MSKTPVFAVILLSIVGAGGTVCPAQEEPPKGDTWQLPLDPGLRRSLIAMEKGLTHEDLTILTGLLPFEERVLVRWERPIRRDGLLTGGQVVLLFDDLFKGFRSERFSLQSGSLQNPGGLYHCMGRWVLRTSSGQTHAIELHMSLRHDAGIWTLRELRQTR